MRVRGAVVLTVTLALALVICDQTSEATWTVSQMVPGSHGSGDFGYRVAVGRGGAIAVAFLRSTKSGDDGSARVAVRRPDGSWERARTVSDPRFGAAEITVAIDARGRVIATWVRTRCRRGERQTCGMYAAVQARMRSAGGGWGPIVTLGRVVLFDSSLCSAVDARGGAIVAWTGTVGVRAVYVSPSGRFGRTVTLGAGAAEAGRGIDVAMSPGGRAYVAWSVASASDPDRPTIDVAVRVLRGKWSRMQRVAPRPATHPRLAVASDGAVILGWRQARPDSEGNGIGFGNVGAAIGAPDGTFTAAIRLSDEPTSEIHLAAGPAGETLLVWGSHPYEPSVSTLSYAVRRTGGSFGSPRRVPGVQADALTLLAGGTALAFRSLPSVQVLERAAGGDFGVATTLTRRGSAPVAAASSSTAAAVWAQDGALRIATRS
jgi:hypothetical protein